MEEATRLEVAELPGEYGPITISERVIQQLWSAQNSEQAA